MNDLNRRLFLKLCTALVGTAAIPRITALAAEEPFDGTPLYVFQTELWSHRIDALSEWPNNYDELKKKSNATFEHNLTETGISVSGTVRSPAVIRYLTWSNCHQKELMYILAIEPLIVKTGDTILGHVSFVNAPV